MADDMRDFELAVLEEAERAAVGDFESVLSMANILKEDALEWGWPEWQAERYAQRVIDEYFAGLAYHLRRNADPTH